MFGIMRSDAPGYQDHVVVPLIRVDDGCADTCMGIDASDDQRGGLQRTQRLIQVCLKKRAVTLLDDNLVRFIPLQLRQDLASFGSRDRDPQATPPHFKERITEVGLELLANPNHRLAEASKRAGEFVDLRNQSPSLGRKCWLPVEEVDQHVDDQKRDVTIVQASRAV